MRVLVTGAKGFIGRHLVDSLNLAHDVIAVCRPSGSRLPGVSWVGADLGAPGFENNLPADVDAVVHLAQSGRYREFPAGAPDMFAVNVASTFRLLQFAATANIERFVLVSSGAVYEPFDGILEEGQRIAPHSMYAASKAAAELLTEPYRGRMDVVSLRVFFPYGCGQTQRLVPGLVERIRQRRPVVLEGESGEGTILTLIHVDDVVGVITRAIEQAWTCAVNVASAEVVSIRNLALTLGDLMGREVEFERHPNREPGDIQPSLDRLRDRVRISDFKPLEVGLADLVEQENWRAT